MTTPLFENVKVLHLESTTDCNLRCPQCKRTEGDLPNDYLAHGELTLEDVKRVVPVELILQLDKMFMCGNFGEPAAARDCLAIYRYFREINPNIELGMNSNGSLRNPKWWAELAQVMGPKGYVVWSIDGMSDTNHVYRRDAIWDKIMANAAAFIANGGNAQWDYLVFEHNKHQVEEAEALAKAMGFTWFRLKETERSVHQTVQWLKKVSHINRPITNNVKCQAKESKSLFLNARGEWYPCCDIAIRVDIRFDQGIRDIPREQITQQIFAQLDTDPHEVCKQICSVSDDVVRIKSQWKKIVQF